MDGFIATPSQRSLSDCKRNINVLALAFAHPEEQRQTKRQEESSENLTRQCIFSQVDMRTGKDLRNGTLWWEKREGSKLTD